MLFEVRSHTRALLGVRWNALSVTNGALLSQSLGEAYILGVFRHVSSNGPRLFGCEYLTDGIF